MRSRVQRGNLTFDIRETTLSMERGKDEDFEAGNQRVERVLSKAEGEVINVGNGSGSLKRLEEL